MIISLRLVCLLQNAALWVSTIEYVFFYKCFRVKRQRYQYKLKQEQKHSTLTDERQALLEKMGFVWDSHHVAWLERWNELRDFHRVNGHSNVPTNYPQNRQLSIWVSAVVVSVFFDLRLVSSNPSNGHFHHHTHLLLFFRRSNANDGSINYILLANVPT